MTVIVTAMKTEITVTVTTVTAISISSNVDLLDSPMLLRSTTTVVLQISAAASPKAAALSIARRTNLILAIAGVFILLLVVGPLEGFGPWEVNLEAHLEGLGMISPAHLGLCHLHHLFLGRNEGFVPVHQVLLSLCRFDLI